MTWLTILMFAIWALEKVLAWNAKGVVLSEKEKKLYARLMYRCWAVNEAGFVMQLSPDEGEIADLPQAKNFVEWVQSDAPRSAPPDYPAYFGQVDVTPCGDVEVSVNGHFLCRNATKAAELVAVLGAQIEPDAGVLA